MRFPDLSTLVGVLTKASSSAFIVLEDTARGRTRPVDGKSGARLKDQLVNTIAAWRGYTG